MNFESARSQMIRQQVRTWEVLNGRVLDVLANVPREFFVPKQYRDLAFADIEIPLGHGQVMMTPKVEGRLLQALDIAPIDSVLEVGSGSGFLTACLAALADTVVSVEILPDLADTARQKISERRIENVELNAQDAMSLSYSEAFDAIAVTGSVPQLTEHFINMLKPEGKLFIVVGRAPVMEARLVTRRAAGEWTEESLFETVLTPLVNAGQPEPFSL
jgi:protein-L-isoaspartate(D-aspartate) O-methyltransferase